MGNVASGAWGGAYPYVAKDGAVGAFTVAVKLLRQDSRDGHGDANEAVVVDADPDDVEPSQAALGRPPRTALTATALGEPINGQDPGFDGSHFAKVGLLVVEVGGDIVTHEGEEGRNGKGLVAIGNDLEVDGVPVPLDLEEGGDGIDGDHEENANDAVRR